MRFIPSSRIPSACSSNISIGMNQTYIFTGRHLYNLYPLPPYPKLGFRFTFDLLKFFLFFLYSIYVVFDRSRGVLSASNSALKKSF